MSEARRLDTLKGYGILDTPPDVGFDAIAEEAARVMRVRSAVVSFIDEDRQWYKARVGVAGLFVPRSLSFCTHVLDDDEVTVVADARRDPRFMASRLVVGTPYIRFYAAAPIKALDRMRLGTVCVFDPVPRDDTSLRERRNLSALAARCVELLEQRRLAQRTGRRPPQPALLARSS